MNIRNIIYRLIEYILPNTQVKAKPRISKQVAVPKVYNKDGKCMAFIFLASPESEHHPYGLTDGRVPSRIIWDRLNYSLNTHFYASEQMFSKHVKGNQNYGLLLEGRAIIPNVYKKTIKNSSYIEENFLALFTHSKELLDKVSNALFWPAYSVWYGTTKWGGNIQENHLKSKMISFVGCDKAMSQMHLFRQRVTQYFLNSKAVDVMGRAVGRFASCDDIYTPYRYNIALENDKYDYYFTEKIMNCFAAKTIPIYYGCPSIGDFFNINGIIIIKEPTLESIQEALSICSEDDYESRREAIEDNFERVKKYFCVEDYLCDNYPDILNH